MQGQGLNAPARPVLATIQGGFVLEEFDNEKFSYRVLIQGDFDGWGYIQAHDEYFDNKEDALKCAKEATTYYGVQYVDVHKHFPWGNQPPSLFKWVKE